MFFRLTLVAGALLGSPLVATPPLTTIQDVLYRADSTRFNGTLQISWNSFEAADTSNITMHSLTVHVVDGTLWVQLVPNTTAGTSAYYNVKYNSDGRVQFEETWAVPASPVNLRVRDVRVASPPPVVADTTLQETDVGGLSADIASRPMKGSGYSPGRAAVVNTSGLLESALGDPTDCVHVDGSSGPCGTPINFVDAETPGGIVDGANTDFALSAAPDPSSSLALFRNGLMQKVGQDYALSGSTVQFVLANVPQPGDTLLAWYRTSTTGTTSSTSSLQSSTQTATAGAIQAAPAGTEVLCAGTGDGGSEGSCTIGAGTLRPGDRLEIRFDYARAADAASFSWEVGWGYLTAASGNSSDALLTGRVDAAVYEAGTQLSWQAWGAAGAPNNGVLNAPNPQATTIDFRGTSAVLRSFTVLRYPKP